MLLWNRLSGAGWALLGEERRVSNGEAIQPVSGHGAQRADAVPHTPVEIDAAGLGEIPYGHWDVAQAEAEPNGLDEQLRVEDEIIRVPLERDPFQDLTAIDPKPLWKSPRFCPSAMFSMDGQ